MAKVSYLFGYDGGRKTLAQMNQVGWWNKVNPELRRRIVALMDACPYDLGVGGGFRTTAQQHALHLAQPRLSPDTPWSFHEASDFMGYGLAVDMLNYNPAIDWANENDTSFGLVDFEATNEEQWHYQPIEIPKRKRLYNPAVHTLQDWNLPTTSNPGFRCVFSTEMLKQGASGNAVVILQTQLANHKWYTARIDGQYGPKTVAAVRLFQTELRRLGLYASAIDGMFGPKSRGAACHWYEQNGWNA